MKNSRDNFKDDLTSRSAWEFQTLDKVLSTIRRKLIIDVKINVVENIVKSIITARNRVENVRMETINCKSFRTVVEAWVLLNVISVFAINALGIHLFASWVFPKTDKLYTGFLQINASSLIFFLLFSNDIIFSKIPHRLKL